MAGWVLQVHAYLTANFINSPPEVVFVVFVIPGAGMSDAHAQIRRSDRSRPNRIVGTLFQNREKIQLQQYFLVLLLGEFSSFLHEYRHVEGTLLHVPNL